MGNYPEMLGLLILVCSVHMLPTPEDGPSNLGQSTMIRQERSAHPGEWNKQSMRNRTRAAINDGSAFIFPDDPPPSKRFTPKFGKRTPECAKGSTFCEAVEDYPSDYLENVLQDKGLEFRAMFGNDIVKDDGTVVHRIDGISENTLCGSMEQIVYPKTAKNKDNQWLFVVNQGPYKQGVRIEKCSSSGNPPQKCAFTDGFPNGYKTFCKQKFIYRRLLALNEDGKTTTDTFQLPSCCACIVTSEDGGLQSRLGSSNSTNPK